MVGFLGIYFINRKGKFTCIQLCFLIFTLMFITPLIKLYILPFINSHLIIPIIKSYLTLNPRPDFFIFYATPNTGFNTAGNSAGVEIANTPNCAHQNLGSIRREKGGHINECRRYFLDSSREVKIACLDRAILSLSDTNVQTKNDLTTLIVGTLMAVDFQFSAECFNMSSLVPGAERPTR